MDEHEWLAERFEAYRTHLRAVAYRLCYECYTALGALRFFVKKGDEQAYQWTRQRILQV